MHFSASICTWIYCLSQFAANCPSRPQIVLFVRKLSFSSANCPSRPQIVRKKTGRASEKKCPNPIDPKNPVSKAFSIIHPMGFYPTLVTEGFKKSRFQTIPYKNTFGTFLRSQKCPNSIFFHESLVQSFFRGKGTHYDFGIFLLNFKEDPFSYDRKCERSEHVLQNFSRGKCPGIFGKQSHITEMLLEPRQNPTPVPVYFLKTSP